VGAPGSPISEHTLRRRVFFYECDGAGIVHFSNYFRYMEEAEHALWRAAGLSIAHREAGVGFPRVAASFEYKRPLRFEDEFDIRILLTAISQRSIKYTCEMTRDGEPIAIGSATIVCVVQQPDKSMKAVPIPAGIADRFAVCAS
jgi:acyl-CoA thioester hydrolase